MPRFTALLIIFFITGCQASYPRLPVFQPLGPSALDSDPFQKSMLVGTTPGSYIGFEDDFREQLLELDHWSGQRHSLVGLFFSLESPNPMHDVPAQLRLLFKYGYTPFINLTSGRSAKEIAEGKIDKQIRKLAQSFLASFKKEPQYKIILAPLPEMNGFWESYGESPVYFKKAYKRIQAIFEIADINNNIYWSFAPNGWARPGYKYKDYYPGDENVDILSYSSYNFGFCSVSQWPKWQSSKQLHSEYLKGLSALAEKKPIIVAQMASTAMTGKGYSLDAKGDWLEKNYIFLESNPKVAAVIYFNIDKECDWAIYQGNNRGVDGYREALKLMGIVYVPPGDIDDFFEKFWKNDDKQN